MTCVEAQYDEATDTRVCPLRVALTGSTGLVGRRVSESFSAEGHRILSLVRRPPQAESDEVFWNPTAQHVDRQSLEGVNVVLHFAGENIADSKWTAAKKDAIRQSRVVGTRVLSETLAGLEHRPQVFISASAIGYYGDQGSLQLTEGNPSGVGFLPSVCKEWEAACGPAVEAGIRVVNLRIGLILAREGGALPRMLSPFKLGLGGPVGDGSQYVSWIALDDLVRVIRFVMTERSIQGPVNAVSPNPVTNAVFAQTLGHVLHRPAKLPMPAVAVKWTLGEMGRTLLLSSTRVVPERLMQHGFSFAYGDLASALEHELHARCD